MGCYCLDAFHRAGIRSRRGLIESLFINARSWGVISMEPFASNPSEI